MVVPTTFGISIDAANDAVWIAGYRETLAWLEYQKTLVVPRPGEQRC